MTEPPPLPEGFVLDAAAPPPLPPGFTLDQSAQPPVPLGQGIVGAATDIPVVGPLLRKANAAIDAATAPSLGYQELPEPTFAERYQSALKRMEQPLAQFSQERPAIDLATRLASTGVATGGLGSTAAGAGLLGMVGSTLPVQIAAGAASGAGISAADAALRGQSLGPAALLGGAFGAAGPVVSRGVAAALPVAAKAAVPATQELKASAKAGYEHPIVKDVEFKPQAVANLADQIHNDLASAGFRPSLASAPGTFSELASMKPPPGVAAVKIADLDSARRALGVYAKQRVEGMPTAEAAAAGRAIAQIDDFLPNLRQSDLLKGDAKAASEILTNARGDYRAYKQAQLAETKMENARIQSASTYGGGNINNALRQAYRPLEVNNFAKASNWSPAAQAALKDVVEGRPLRNIARDIGRSAPTGPVNLGMHAMAAAATGGLSLPFAAASYVAKKIGEAGTQKAARRLSEVIRSESPLARARAAGTPPPTPRNMAVLRQLFLAQAARGAQPLYFPP